MEEVKSKKLKEKEGLLALSPLLVFVVLYLVTSIIVQDFYKVPLTVAFLLSGIYAVGTSGSRSLGCFALLSILLRYPRKYSSRPCRKAVLPVRCR